MSPKVEDNRNEMNDLLLNYTEENITFENLMDQLANLGLCVCLLNDDNGHWAVVADGFQSVPDGKDDVETHFFVKKEQWHDSIYDAMVYFLKN